MVPPHRRCWLVVLSTLLVVVVDLIRAEHTHVICDRISALVVRECPQAYPVCCVWPNYFTACCPAGSQCDMFRGECVSARNRTTAHHHTKHDATGSAVSGEDGDSSSSESDASENTNGIKAPGGVEMTLQFASSFFGVFFFAVLMLFSGAMGYGKLVATRHAEARRQRELEARELLVPDGDATDDEEGDGNGGHVAVPVGASAEQRSEEAEELVRRRTDDGEGDGGEDNGTEMTHAADKDLSTVTGAVNGHQEEEDDEELLCKICFSNVMDCALVRCGHVATCRWCAKKLRNCPMCREPVVTMVRLAHVKAIRSHHHPSTAATKQPQAAALCDAADSTLPSSPMVVVDVSDVVASTRESTAVAVAPVSTVSAANEMEGDASLHHSPGKEQHVSPERSNEEKRALLAEHRSSTSPRGDDAER